MSLQTTESLAQFAIATLGQAVQPPFEIQNATDFVVVYTSASTATPASTDTVLVLNVDYTVSGTFTNGTNLAPTVTLEATGLHYAVGGTLTVARAPQETQELTLVDGVTTPASAWNTALNWLAYHIQALRDRVDRTLQLSLSSAVQEAFEIAGRAGQLLGFDASGNFALLTYPVIPAPAAGFSFNSNLTQPTGGTSVCLDDVDASAISPGNVVCFTNKSGPANVMSAFQLTTSSAATGPNVVAALNNASCRWIQIL